MTQPHIEQDQAAPLLSAPLLTGHQHWDSDDINVLHDAVEPYAVGHDLQAVDDRVPLDGEVNALTLGEVSLVWVRYGGKGVIVDTPPTNGEFAMCAPVAPMSVEYRASNARDVADSTLVLSHDEPMRMRPHPEQGCLVIATSTGRLTSHLRDYLGQDDPLPLLRFHTGPGPAPSVHPPATVEHTWRHVCTMLEQTASTGLHPLAARALEDSLLTALLLGLPHTATPYLTHIPSASARRDSTRVPGYLAPLIRDWLHANYHRPISVADIAAAVGVSVRQLQLTCRHHWGQTPMQLLRGLRLDHARTLLQRSSPAQTTIPEVAAAAGYLNPSRFGTQYTQRFGETPTQTLKRSAR